jgi:hypothetical protein
LPVTKKDIVQFDPSKYGAIEVKEQPVSNFDPSKYGAIEVKKKDGTPPSTNGSSIPTSQLQSGLQDGIDVKQAAKDFETQNPDHSIYDTENPVDLAAKAKNLSQSTDVNLVGTHGIVEMPNQKDVDEGNKINDYLKKKGYNPDLVNNAFSDLPKEAYDVTDNQGNKNQTQQQLLEELKNDPIGGMDKINNIKNQFKLQDAGYNEALEQGYSEDEAKNIGKSLGNQFNELHGQPFQNMDELYENAQKQLQLVNTHLIGDERQQAADKIKDNMSKFINSTQPALLHDYENSDLKNVVTPDEFAGLQTWKVFDPQKYNQEVDFLGTEVNTPQKNTDQNQFVKIDGAGNYKPSPSGDITSRYTTDMLIGKENIHRQLAEQGRQNALENLTSQQYNLNQAHENATDDTQKNAIASQYLNNQQQINNIKIDAQKDDARYPISAKLKFDNQIKEITNDAGQGAGEYGFNRFIKGFSNTGDSVEDLLTSLFGSKTDNTKLAMRRSGEQSDYDTNMYLPEGYRSDNSPYILQASKSLKDAANTILNGRSISDLPKEDKDKLTKLIQNNQGEIQTVTNPDAGKSKNFFSKSTMYNMAGFTGDIASFVAQTAGLGALGLGSKTAELSTLFNTTYSPSYNEAIEQGMSPSAANQYAMVHGGIALLAGVVSSKYDAVKGMLDGGKSDLSKTIAGIGEDGWNKVVNDIKPSMLQKIKDAVKNVGGENAKMLATYGVGTSIVNDLADKGFFNKNISTDDIINHAVQNTKDMAIGLMPLAGIGFFTHIAKSPVTMMDKAALWENGDNPDIGKAKIDEAVQRGDITPQQGEARKKAIDNVATLINKIPDTNEKGKPLTDQQKTEYLYNLVVKDKSKELDEAQTEKNNPIIEAAEKENKDIVSGKNKQTEPILSNTENKPTQNQPAHEAGVEPASNLSVGQKINVDNQDYEIKSIDNENGKVTMTNGITFSKDLVEKNISSSKTNDNEQVKETNAEKINSDTKNKGAGTGNENPPASLSDSEGKTNKISKKGLKQDYDFSKNFPSRNDQQVSDETMDRLNLRAKNNNISVEQQAANEVLAMKNKKGEASEHDIITAAFHLRNLDKQIEDANKNGEDASHLLHQRDEALTSLRKLGNNAGRNLRLFGAAYKLTEDGRLETTRAQLKRDLGVSDIPKTMTALRLSKLSPEDKKKVEPYVKELEKVKKTIDEINAKADKATVDLKSKEVQDYIEQEVAKRLKEQKPNTPTAREKKSQQIRDIAKKIRTENELDKFQKSASQITKNSIFGDIDFKELAAQALDYIAAGVEKGEDLAKLIREATAKMRGKFDAIDFGKAITQIVSKSSLPDKTEVIDKIKAMAENESATTITPDMVKHGLINDVVKDYIHSDTPSDKVISEATKELKTHLPDVTKEQVEDAILKRGEFKQQTKTELNKDVADKAKDVKRLAAENNDNRTLGNGIRKETQGNAEIKIAKDAQDFIDEMKNDDTLSDETKKEHIKSIEADRDEKLQNTRQGVLTNLKDSIDNHVAELTSKQNDAIVDKDTEKAKTINEVKRDLQDLSDRLKPNSENLKDQIDKDDQDLNAIIKSNKGTEFSADLKDIQDKYHSDWQKTADQLERQGLLNKAEASKKEAEIRLSAGQYTEIPKTPYDVKNDTILAQKEADSKKAWQQLNSMAKGAKEKSIKRGIVGKWLEARRQWLIASIPAVGKVLGSGITKPFIDPFIKQTFGRLSGLITGITPTSLKRLPDTYRQMRDENAANRFMKNLNQAHVDAIVNYDKVKREFPNDEAKIKAAKDKLLDAEIDNNAALGYLFVNAGSHIDIKQIMLKGATDFDAKMGKYAQSSSKERTNMEGLKFWLESVNRTHAAIKSFSHRQALFDTYIENLQHFQKQDGSLNNESRQRAWDMAVLESEQGRFGEKTILSDAIGNVKSSQTAWKRNAADYLLPVAKISINLTKQGADMAFPFIEAGVKSLDINAIKGMKLNAKDGIEYKNFVSKYFNGVKRGFNELPLEQKKYINTLITRGLFGAAQYGLVGYLLASGGMKYGGSYDSSDPYHKHPVIGSDGKPLDYGEWEMEGVRMPKIVNLIINHSPYSMPASIAAVSYDQMQRDDKKGLQIYHSFTKTLNEFYNRLPFKTGIDVGKALTGDSYKLQHIIAGEVPTFKTTAEYFDKNEQGDTRKVNVKGDGFWETTGNIIKSNLPGFRNTLPTK